MSAGVAHADPDVFLTQSQAYAGEAISFSIGDIDDRVKYEVEVADRDVLKGEADADDGVTISAQFTMPDLGPSSKSVTVEIEARDDDGTTTLKRKLQYLGHAPAAVEAPPAPAAAAPAPSPAPAAAPAPGPAPAANSAPKGGKRAGSDRKQRKRGHTRKRRASKRIHESAAGRQHKARPVREEADKPQRKKRQRARAAPLFDGVPESDTGGAQVGDDGLSKARRAKPPAAVAVTPVASKDGEPAVAILVPGVLALAGFLLAGATLLRRRRLR